MSIHEAGLLCAQGVQFFLYCKTRRLITQISNSRNSLAATVALLATLLCAGCIGPFRASKKCDLCSENVNDSANCETPASGDCVQKPCCHERFRWRSGCTYLHVICWPCGVCRGALNFCAHNEAVGPPDIQAPGRFHPVPTHPVFAPAPGPVEDPNPF